MSTDSIPSSLTATHPDKQKDIRGVICGNIGCNKNITHEAKYSRLGWDKFYCKKCYFTLKEGA
jgi:hypothetical protein